jgi:MOSC domain-containing protein YiiM
MVRSSSSIGSGAILTRAAVIEAMRIESVNIGRPTVLMRHGRRYSTAINRRPVDGAVMLTRTGFEGDRVSDDRAHGGPERAACCYPIEHYEYWRRRLPSDMTTPGFGENLTTRGLLEEEVCIGDVLAIGGAVVRISSPRQPCAKLALKHDEPRLPLWINETAFCGFYVGVVQEGPIALGEGVQLVERPHAGMTVALAARLRVASRPDPALIEQFVRETPLSQSFRDSLLARLRTGL